MNSSRIAVHFTRSRSKIWAPLALLTFYNITRYIKTIDHYCCENCVVKKRLIAVNYNWVLILKLSGKKEHSIVTFRAPAGLQDSALKEKSQWGQMSLDLLDLLDRKSNEVKCQKWAGWDSGSVSHCGSQPPQVKIFISFYCFRFRNFGDGTTGGHQQMNKASLEKLEDPIKCGRSHFIGFEKVNKWMLEDLCRVWAILVMIGLWKPTKA